MSLFINKNGHPDVFKNERKIEGTNQKNFKIDPLSEWMSEQKRTFETMNNNLVALDESLGKTKNKQVNQWRSISHQLHRLTEQHTGHVQFESRVLKSLNELEEKNEHLQLMIKNGTDKNQSFLERINTLQTMNTNIVNKIEGAQSISENLSSKVDEQINQQKILTDKYSKQEEIQLDVLQRLEKQEGLTEKVLRQLDHFRSILFERTSFLAEKIEQLFELTSLKKTKLKVDTLPSAQVYKLKDIQDEEKSVRN